LRATRRISTFYPLGQRSDELYDANSSAVQGNFLAGGIATRQAWTYDAIGNVLTFRTFENGAQKSATINQYETRGQFL
jgi:hypothetical protein